MTIEVYLALKSKLKSRDDYYDTVFFSTPCLKYSPFLDGKKLGAEWVKYIWKK